MKIALEFDARWNSLCRLASNGYRSVAAECPTPASAMQNGAKGLSSPGSEQRPARRCRRSGLDRYNVVWTTPGKDAGDSMPLGNGEVGINLWVEEDGDLLFYISRTDSLSEVSRLLKVGEVRVSLSPNPFAAGSPFSQELSPARRPLRNHCGQRRQEGDPGGVRRRRSSPSCMSSASRPRRCRSRPRSRVGARSGM